MSRGSAHEEINQFNVCLLLNSVKPIRIYRHNESVGAGYFIDALKRHNFSYELVAIDRGDFVKHEFNDASGLVFLGSTANISDQYSWIEDELRLIRTAFKRRFPIFGHCFGAQLISKAMGGEVEPMQAKEIGWHPIEFLDNPVTREWFQGLSQKINALHWHEYSLTVPKNTTPLFGTQFCPNQAFVADNVIATIAHVEVTSDLLKQWLAEYGDHLSPVSESVQSVAEVGKNLDIRISNMQQLTDVLYNRWFEMVAKYNQN